MPESQNEHIPTFYTKEELEYFENEIKKYIKMGEDRVDTITPTNNDDVVTKHLKITAIIALDARSNGYEEYVDIYAKYPPFLFYTDDTNISIRRIYGLMNDGEGNIRAHAVNAMIMINNETIYGIPLDECKPVKQWSESQLSKLNSGLVRGKEIFLNVEGYLYLENNRKL